MDKPKRKAKRTIRWHTLLLALMMTGTTLVMGGSIILAGLVIRSNSQMRQEMNAYQATGEAQPTQTPVKEVLVITATTVSTSTPVPRATSTPRPTRAAAQPTRVVPTRQPVLRFECDHEAALLKALENGGQIFYQCVHVIHLKQTIHIWHDTTLTGDYSKQPLFTGDHELPVLFYVHNGAHLTLRYVALHDSQWRGIQVEQGATLTLDSAYLFGHGIKAYQPAENDLYYSGAVWNAGETTVINSTFDQNSSPGGGAALNNSSTGVLVIENSRLLNNVATTANRFAGGAVLNYGSLTVKDSHFNNNSAYGGYGGALASVSGEVALVNTSIHGNGASMGGGIYNAPASHMTIEDGRFAYNTGQGGAFYNQGTLNLYDTYIALTQNACLSEGTLYDPSQACG